MDFDWQAWKWRSPSLTWLCNFYFQSSEICLKLGENAAWLQVKYKFLKPKGHRNHTPIRDNLSCVLTERFFQRDSLMNIVCFLAYCGCRCFPPSTPQPKIFPWKIDISRGKKWHVAAMEGSKSSSHSIWVCILHTLQWSLAQVTWHPELKLLQSGKGSIFYIFLLQILQHDRSKGGESTQCSSQIRAKLRTGLGWAEMSATQDIQEGKD